MPYETISDSDFAKLGGNQLAYIKQVDIAGDLAFAIHGADGTPLKVTETVQEALEITKDHEIKLMRVH